MRATPPRPRPRPRPRRPAILVHWPANGEDANPTEAKCVEAISTIATEFLCPVAHELPIAPVMAKDGVVYERAAIERWFKTKEGDPNKEWMAKCHVWLRELDDAGDY